MVAFFFADVRKEMIKIFPQGLKRLTDLASAKN